MGGNDTSSLFQPTSVSFTYNDLINSKKVFNVQLDRNKIEWLDETLQKEEIKQEKIIPQNKSGLKTYKYELENWLKRDTGRNHTFTNNVAAEIESFLRSYLNIPLNYSLIIRSDKNGSAVNENNIILVDVSQNACLKQDKMSATFYLSLELDKAIQLDNVSIGEEEKQYIPFLLEAIFKKPLFERDERYLHCAFYNGDIPIFFRGPLNINSINDLQKLRLFSVKNGLLKELKVTDSYLSTSGDLSILFRDELSKAHMIVNPFLGDKPILDGQPVRLFGS